MSSHVALTAPMLGSGKAAFQRLSKAGLSKSLAFRRQAFSVLHYSVFFRDLFQFREQNFWCCLLFAFQKGNSVAPHSSKFPAALINLVDCFHFYGKDGSAIIAPYRIVFSVPVLLLTASLLSCKDKEVELNSRWRNSDIVVDGNASEWAEAMTLKNFSCFSDSGSL